MSYAFKYEYDKLESTTWTDYDSYASQFPNSIYHGVANLAIKKNEMDAITLSDQVIYNSNKIGEIDFAYWLPTIAHEQSHVQDYAVQGAIPFWIKYGVENFTRSGYGSEETEVVAYGRDEDFSNWLNRSEGSPFTNLENIELYLKGSFTNDEKITRMISMGKKYRYKSGIDHEISYINGKIKGLQEELLTQQNVLKQSQGRAPTFFIENNINSLQSKIDGYSNQINELKNEKAALSKEF
jgi:hypothetical protein